MARFRVYVLGWIGVALLCMTPALPEDPGPIPVPGTSPSPGVSLSPGVERLTGLEARQLLRAFNLAQANELRALKHRYDVEIQELKASQKARLKEWEKKEQDARHKFFAMHTKGPDRRAYIQDYLSRRKIFLQLQTDEKTQRQHAQEVHMQAVKQDQLQRMKEFQEYISQGSRPPLRLWPSAS